MAEIRYRVEIEDARSHCFVVTLTIPAPDTEQIVSLPAWIPGSYLLREFARHLNDLRASQGGQPRELAQLDKATWRIRCAGRAALRLRYRVYAFDTSVRAAYLDAQRGFFNGSSLLLRVHGRETQPQALELGRLPTGWQLATAMPATGARRYRAADYDELVDHPFELGPFWRGRFDAHGVEHEFIVAGALPVFDGERLLADARRICETQIEFWHGRRRDREAPPFQRYTFLLNAVDEGGGGLEHRASTALIAPRRDLPRLGQGEAGDGYVRLLSLISHEYFHSWNVKRLRPAEFAQIDYTRENYTELLWFFEGFTSYYDELLLLRAGLIDLPRYLKLLAANVSSVLAAPGRKQQSLAQSSFDAWVRYYRQDENTPNSTVSYYAKGALLALALDLSLRSGSDARAASSVDALMRRLWQRSGGGPVSEADILAGVEALGGAALAGQLRDWVHGTEDLPLPALLERFGVQWRDEKPNLAQRLGLRVAEGGNGVAIKQVLADSAAQAAGFCAGDEIIGCNSWRLRRLDEALLGLNPAAPGRLRFLLARDQRLLELDAELPSVRPGMAPVALGPADRPPARALGLRRAWLGG
ncbi:M61 family metallopeptidase [Roseateles violae]|uniref:PDZ domain-containing protein n=1 Tax=Roseateles violae TaxID=3058042 RepID=A0ABT8DRM5_9BURK|nr:PDZ domain-containing protein [Pelomonas sp. PFR6]MDN3920990.1 PDZ domain-containing protein [Pelomonas sp. PFR6]